MIWPRAAYAGIEIAKAGPRMATDGMTMERKTQDRMAADHKAMSKRNLAVKDWENRGR